MLMWPWQKNLCTVLDTVDLPQVAAASYKGLSANSVIVRGTEIHNCIYPVVDTLEPGWGLEISDEYSLPSYLQMFLSKSSSAGLIVPVVQELTERGGTVSIIVATGETYRPYAELPIYSQKVSSEIADGVPISDEMTVQQLAEAVSVKMGQPCCMRAARLPCSRVCERERVHVFRRQDD
jgi:hypothetical protein